MELDGVNFKITADHSQLPTAEQAMRELGDTAEMTGADMSQMGKQAQQAGQQAAAAGKGIQGASSAVNRASGGMSKMSYTAGQLSYQLQDIAVQAQMGTNAFTILAQQGPQIASVFGPGGAVFGAIIGVGAALGGTLVSAMMDVEEETKELELSVEDLADRYDELTAAQRNWLSLRSVSQAEELRTRLNELANTVESYQNRLSLPNLSSEKLEQWTLALAEARAEADFVRQQLDDLQGGMNGLAGASAKMVERLEQEAETLGMTAEERALHVIAINSENDALIERAAIAAQTIKAYREEQEALREQMEERRKAEREAERAAARAKRQYESEMRQAQNRLDKIMEMNLTEVELAKKRNDDLLTDLEQWHERGMISTEEFAAARKELEISANKEIGDSYRELLAIFDEGQSSYNDYYDTIQRIADANIDAAQKTDLMAAAFRRLQEQQKEAYSLDSAPDVGESMGGLFGQFAQLDEAEASVNQWYENQLDKLNEFRELKAERTAEWDEMEAEAYRTQQEKLNQIDMARKDLQLATAESAFGSVADTMRTAFGEQSGIYKIAFAAEKAFAIARSIVAIQAGIAQAASLPFPANLAAMATVAANTASIVGNIQAVAMVGQAHDGIDSVPREGTWLLDKGERVVDRRTNEDLKDFLANGGSVNNNSSNINQTINITGSVDRRTSAQIAQDAARKQRIANARFGQR